MDILDSKIEHAREKLAPGTTFVLQGSHDKAFVILHTGMAELLINDEAGDGVSPEHVLDGSHRIGFIKGESILGYIGILRKEKANSVSIRTMTECTVSLRPMSFEDLAKLIRNDKALFSRLIKSLIGHFETTLELSKGYRALKHRLMIIADTLALVKADNGMKAKDEVQQRSPLGLNDYAAYLHKRLSDRNLKSPKTWDFDVFKGTLQNELGLYAEEQQGGPEIDRRQFSFLRSSLKKGEGTAIDNLFGDKKAKQYIFDFMDNGIIEILKYNAEVTYEIGELLDILYSRGGWTDQVRKMHFTGQKDTANFLHFLARFSLECRKDVLALLGTDPLNDYEAFEGLKEFKSFQKASDSDESVTSIPGGLGSSSGVDTFEGLLEQILDFADMNDGFCKELTELVDGFLKEPDVEGRYTRLSTMFWELYEEAFLKVIGTDMRGFVPGIMLHLGVLDERMLSIDELKLIKECYSTGLFIDDNVPVMTLPYYLEKIYKGEIEPSMDDMGDVFATVMKKQTKLSKKNREEVYIYQDSPGDRVRFELRQVSRELSGMLFGNRKKSLPFLFSSVLHGSGRRLFVEPEKVEQIVGKYMERDYSLFYREVLLKHELGTDFIHQKVVPDFVLYPGFGSRMVMWQEMDGNKKGSAGRIFLPSFFAEKLEDNLLQQIAHFRWELQKSISGYNWTDPVEGALVGSYYHYISFYKKNPDISPEGRVRLAEFIKKTKSDKDRFAHDYGLWVESEYSGMVKLNNPARDIFYRFCPFPQTVRDQLAKRPGYENLEIRFINRRNKLLRKIKSIVLKYEKAEKPVPEELLSYLEYLQK